MFYRFSDYKWYQRLIYSGLYLFEGLVMVLSLGLIGIHISFKYLSSIEIKELKKIAGL